MPSTVVHLALAGLLAAGLLGDAFDLRAVGIVFAVVVLADLDVFVGLVLHGTHRAALHSVFIPLGIGAVLYYDTRVRERSVARERWGTAGVRVAWVSLLAFGFAAIGLDLVTGGANLFYPVHDQFYRLRGEFLYSTQRGLVQTFVEFGNQGVDAGGMGSTESVHINSGVDPTRGQEPEDVDRIFPVAQSGWQLLLVVSSAVVLAGRLWETRKV